MNNTIRIAKHTLDAFTQECKQQGIGFINLGEVDGDIRIMLDTDDLLDAYSLGYIMGVTAMMESVKNSTVTYQPRNQIDESDNLHL